MARWGKPNSHVASRHLPAQSRFSLFGINGVIVISESHLSVHTWPEYRYAAVDIFSCGDALRPDVAISDLAKRFAAERVSVVAVQRCVFIPSFIPLA